jgi:hypothetical protein
LAQGTEVEEDFLREEIIELNLKFKEFPVGI